MSLFRQAVALLGIIHIPNGIRAWDHSIERQDRDFTGVSSCSGLIMLFYICSAFYLYTSA